MAMSENNTMNQHDSDSQHQHQSGEKHSPKPPPSPDTTMADQASDNVVRWKTDDEERPKNMSLWRKIAITTLTSTITLTISFGSSVFSATTPATTREFGVSQIIIALGVSLYVLGFALGPLFWGPLSEYVGRKIPLATGFVLFAVCQIPIALSPSIAGVLIARFLSGAFGSALLAINAAMFADYWGPVDRGVATALFSIAVFAGPTLGPIVGSFVTASSLGWRWTAWLTLILAGVSGIPTFWFLPETYEPVLLAKKAHELREQTDNDALHAEHEVKEFNVKIFIRQYLVKPFRLLLLEPILLVLTIYISLIYGILYLCFFAVPYAYMSQRGWTPTSATLPFIAILIGIALAGLVVSVYTKTYYQTRLRQRDGQICPEDRLPVMIAGSLSMPIGLFWFAWTSNPSHVSSWVPQVAAGIPIGFAIPMIFMPGIAYLVDVYRMHASSAISANTFVRSITAAAFPLFAPAMYHRLGVEWATSLLGFLTVMLIPAPILFYFYGPAIRRRSRFCPPPPSSSKA